MSRENFALLVQELSGTEKRQRTTDLLLGGWQHHLQCNASESFLFVQHPFAFGCDSVGVWYRSEDTTLMEFVYVVGTVKESKFLLFRRPELLQLFEVS